MVKICHDRKNERSPSTSTLPMWPDRAQIDVETKKIPRHDVKRAQAEDQVARRSQSKPPERATMLDCAVAHYAAVSPSMWPRLVMFIVPEPRSPTSRTVDDDSEVSPSTLTVPMSPATAAMRATAFGPCRRN